MSENYNHNRTNTNKWHIHKNLTMRICLLELDARKCSCAKISSFTVYPSCFKYPHFSYFVHIAIKAQPAGFLHCPG